MVRGFTFVGKLLEAAFQILEDFVRGQGRAQRGRRPLHKIRVCLSLGTTFYKHILPKYDVILNFPNNIQNKKQRMCFPVHTIQVYRRLAWCFWRVGSFRGQLDRVIY